MTELMLGSEWTPDPFEIADCKRAVRRLVEVVVAVSVAVAIGIAVATLATGTTWTGGGAADDAGANVYLSTAGR